MKARVIAVADRTHDAVADELDNCAATTNVDQLDSDGDGTGNACDATPMPADNGAFAVDGATLKLARTPDFESKAHYAIRILPLSGITLSGSGASRSARISANAKRTGTAVVTLQVADSKASTGSVTITVSVGSAAADSMNGTSRRWAVRGPWHPSRGRAHARHAGRHAARPR